MERGLHRMLQNVGGAGGLGGAQPDAPMLDTSEQVYISSLALLKMLKHGEAGSIEACGIIPSRNCV